MKTITKKRQPSELIRWKKKNAAVPQNLVYGHGGFPSEEVRNSLLKEQFHLCAYTMRRLLTESECENKDTRNSCHIEHFLPQCRKVPGEDIDFKNMLACYPPSQSTVACDFGAHAKADFDPSGGGFVSPLSKNAQDHFIFDEHGQVRGSTTDGINTIKVLNLSSKTLVNDRAAVIRGYLKPKGKKLSAKNARELAKRIMHPDNDLCLPPYCVAVLHAALQFAEREERRAARMKKKPRV